MLVMKTGWIWAAVSSAEQVENVSLENQIRMGLEHAAKHGVLIRGALVVPGKSRHIVLFDRAATQVSGYLLDSGDIESMSTTPLVDIMKRKQEVYPYAELLSILEQSRPDSAVFFFLNRSRLGRTAALSMAIIGLCREYRVKAYDLESPPASLEITNSRDDAYVGAFKSTEAENQIWAIQENHRKGMIRRVEKYGRMPGKVNFGYNAVYENGKLTGYSIDEQAAETIRMIVSLYLDGGYGALHIADKLNMAGRPAPAGGEWGHSQITFVLRRMWRYAGFAELNKNTKTGRPYIRVKGNWPAIITEEDVRRIEAEREARKGARKSVHTVYRFTRMVYCGICGARFHAAVKWYRKKLKDGTMKRYERVAYRCPGDHTSIAEPKLIAALADYIAQRLNTHPSAQDMVPPDEPDIATIITADIAALNAQVANLQAAITNADLDYYVRHTLDDIRHGAVVSAIKKQIVDAQSEITTLTDTLHQMAHEGDRQKRMDDARVNGLDRLHDADVRSANAWLRERFRFYVENSQVVRVRIL